MFAATRLDEISPEVWAWVAKIKLNLNSPSLARNPMTGDVVVIDKIIIFKATPIYPDFIPDIFIYWIMRHSLRKAGHDGKISRVSKKEVLNILFENVTRRHI